MGFLSRDRGAEGATTMDQNGIGEQQQPSQTVERQSDVVASNEKSSGEDAIFSENAQAGVQKIEAAAMVWDKKHLIAVYAL